MMKIPTCCGNRMSLDLNTDETFCDTCRLRLSGQEIVQRELQIERLRSIRKDEIVITPPRMYPITIKSDPTREDEIVIETAAVDPLDVVIDRGWTLRDLIEAEQNERREQCGLVMAGGWRQCATTAQREAVSTYWSAQLRVKVAMSAEQDAERDRLQVVMEYDEL